MSLIAYDKCDEVVLCYYTHVNIRSEWCADVDPKGRTLQATWMENSYLAHLYRHGVNTSIYLLQ